MSNCERMSGVTIYLVNEHPGWSNKRCTNIRGGNLIGVRMSGVVIWYVHELPALSKIACERMSVWTNIRDSLWHIIPNKIIDEVFLGIMSFSTLTHEDVLADTIDLAKCVKMAFDMIASFCDRILLIKRANYFNTLLTRTVIIDHWCPPPPLLCHDPEQIP